MLRLLLLLAVSNTAIAQESRLLRFPAVHGNQVVFTYAGDLYTVARSGGVARKITSDIGYEMFPHFSHDGRQIAFTGQYDGNTEVYTMPASGGVPKRITYTATLGRDDVSDRMGPNNVVMCWTPDDKKVVYRGRGTTFNTFKGKLYQAPVSGDLPEELPFAVASWCSYNADGSQLAMNQVFREFRTWKYYKGGMADDIYLYDTKSHISQNITNNPAQDIFPMYSGNKVYFLSDRDRTMNLFAYDVATKEVAKLTDFKTYDIKFPSLGNDGIAFENAGFIYIYDFGSGKANKLDIRLEEDFASGRTKQIDASKFVENYAVSPDGKRAVFSARGDIFTIPAKNGVTRNLTQTSGAHDRNVDWSPDGKWVAFISDKTGEDEIYIQKQDGADSAKAITKGGGSYKFFPLWSPNSKYVLYGDRAQNLFWVNAATGVKTLIIHSTSSEMSDYSWSPDSKWVAYTEPGKARVFDIIRLYNMETAKKIAVTDSWYSSNQPAFSPDGKLLYFISSRDFNPIYGNTEFNHVYVDMDKPYFVRLSADTKSVFENENDEVVVKEDKNVDELTEPGAKNETLTGNRKAKQTLMAKTPADTIKKPAAEVSKNVVVKVDEEGMADRIESLPVIAGNFYGICAVADGLYYTNASIQSPPTLKLFSFKDKKEIEIGQFNGYATSADNKKILFKKGNDFYMEDLGNSKIEPKNKLNLDGLKTNTDLHAEWRQVFDESWRQMRDYFYDPNMHGLDWKAMHDKYAVLLPYVNHRNDLTYIIGEMIGELSIGHAYVNSGDRPEVPRIKMGLLGARFSRDATGYYRIDSILSGESWDKTLVSPFKAPGIKIMKGDYIISINGTDTRKLGNLFQALIGQAGQTIELMTNSSPSANGAKKSLVKPIADEADLYYHEWVQGNITKVTQASGGKIGYLHIPDMGPEGLNQFARYFYPQLDKQALIIDDRGNGGGNVSPMIIERLRREPGLATMNRNNETAGMKPTMQIGPKLCLIDQYSASDGDLFPYQFQYYKIGPLVGKRTWGGVVGIRGSLPFIDGGDMRKPEFAHFAADGSKFIIEGDGVHPDIEVTNDPYQEYNGNDAQLSRAISELLQKLKEPGAKGVPPIPAFPDKSGK